MDPHRAWPPQSLIEDLAKECANNGPLYIPPPCDNYATDDSPAGKARRVNLGTMFVAKVNKNDNKVAGRADLQEEIKLVRERAARSQFPLLTEDMVSGYGGFVPKNQFQLGKTYQETCIKSIAELEAEKGGKSSDQCQPSQMSATKRASNLGGPGSQDFVRIHELNTTDYLSPYKMENADPEKYYKSGYAGFIPRTQNKIGTNIEVTHTALNEFTDAQKKLGSAARKHDSNKC